MSNQIKNSPVAGCKQTGLEDGDRLRSLRLWRHHICAKCRGQAQTLSGMLLLFAFHCAVNRFLVPGNAQAILFIASYKPNANGKPWNACISASAHGVSTTAPAKVNTCPKSSEGSAQQSLLSMFQYVSGMLILVPFAVHISECLCLAAHKLYQKYSLCLSCVVHSSECLYLAEHKLSGMLILFAFCCALTNQSINQSIISSITQSTNQSINQKRMILLSDLQKLNITHPHHDAGETRLVPHTCARSQRWSLSVIMTILTVVVIIIVVIVIDCLNLMDI